MIRQKSIAVTVIVAVLMIAVLYSTWALESRIYLYLAAALGVYGFACAAFNFCRWLGRETPLLPAQTTEEQIWTADREYRTTYDEIRREVEEGRL